MPGSAGGDGERKAKDQIFHSPEVMVSPQESKLWNEIDQAIGRAENAGLDNKHVLGLMLGFTSRIVGISYATLADLEQALPIITGALAREARDYFRERNKA